MNCFYSLMPAAAALPGSRALGGGPMLYRSTTVEEPRVDIYQGEAAYPFLAEVQELRAKLFVPFPYLYRAPGSVADEDVSCYAAAAETIIVRIVENEQLVALGVGLPLKEYKNPSENFYAEEKLASVLPEGTADGYYYVSELFVSDAQDAEGNYLFRGRGFSHLLLKTMEKAVSDLENKFHTLCLLSVERPDDHPLKSEKYFSAEAIWIKNGYSKIAATISYEWPTMQSDGSVISEFPNPMGFWVKSLIPK